MNSLKVIVADNKGLVVFSIILLPLFSGFAYLNFIHGGVLLPLCVISVMYCSVFYIIKSFKIEVQTNLLVYSSPFSHDQSIKFRDVNRVSVDIGSDFNDSKKKYSVFRLILSPEKSSNDEVIINLKLFRKEDVTFLLNRIKISSPKVEFDDLSNELLKQNFSPLTDALMKKILNKSPSIFVFIILLIMSLSLVPKD